MNNLIISIFILIFLTTADLLYDHCPSTDLFCKNAKFVLEGVDNCKGIIICYKSLYANPDKLLSSKFNKFYNITKGDDESICEKNMEFKSFINKNNNGYSNGYWSGIIIFYDEKNKMLDLQIDVFGRFEKFKLTGITPSDFIEGIFGKRTDIFEKMINQNDEDKRFLKMKPEGTVLEDHIGLIAVKMDSGICGPILGNDVFYAVLKRNDIEGCEEKITTTLAPTTFPCHPEFYKKYGCNCGLWNGNFDFIDICCKKHHECIALLKDKCYSQCVKQECQFYPARYYSVSINSSHYNWKCDEGKKSFQCLPDNECEQALCECDRSAAECWVKIPEPMYKEDLCLSVAMDFSRMLSNISFEIVAGVGMKVKQAGEELSLIIKNAKENRKIENLKKANLVVLNAMNTLDEGIRLIEKGEEFMNNTFEVAKLKEEMARKNFELTKTKENIVEEIFSFDMVMLHFIGTKLFAREKNNVLETMKETFKKIEEVEDLIV